MSFRNFVVASGAKEVSFLPKEPNEVSYGFGSPSVSVNNQEGDAQMIEPIGSVQPTKPSKASKRVNVEETSQLVENVAEFDDPPSKDDQVTIIGSSSGIVDRVRNKKGTSAKAVKATPKRKLMLPTPPTRNTRQKGQLTTQKAVEVLSENEDIHGKHICYYFSGSTFMHLLIHFNCTGLSNTKELPNASACHHLVEHITPTSWRSTLTSMPIEELFDLHDKSYTRQAVLDNHLNAR